jgi:bacillithiol disulfide reductase
MLFMSESVAQFDLVIIGAGPAGISAAETAKREGLNYLVIEKGLIANTIYRYPVGRTVFSTCNELEMREDTLRPCREKPTREELLTHYVQFALSEDLNILTEEEVTAVESDPSGQFLIGTTRGKYHATRLLFTIGAMAHPRLLNVPGEDMPKVKHRFVEPYPYVKKDALVVGGGNSAAEAALFLSEEGARTTLAIWPSDWENHDPKRGAIKHWVRTPLEKQIADGRLNLLLFNRVKEIKPDRVLIEASEGTEVEIANDAVFVLIGADADLTLLKRLGVQTIQAGFNEIPVYDPETFETNVPGIYVAGHFTQARHIKEAIAVPRRIVPLIAQSIRVAA